jgi:hypothetical protein
MKGFVIKLNKRQNSEVKALRNSIQETKSDIQLTTFTAIEPDTFDSGLKRLKYLDQRYWRWT